MNNHAQSCMCICFPPLPTSLTVELGRNCGVVPLPGKSYQTGGRCLLNFCPMPNGWPFQRLPPRVFVHTEIRACTQMDRLVPQTMALLGEHHRRGRGLDGHPVGSHNSRHFSDDSKPSPASPPDPLLFESAAHICTVSLPGREPKYSGLYSENTVVSSLCINPRLMTSVLSQPGQLTVVVAPIASNWTGHFSIKKTEIPVHENNT